MKINILDIEYTIECDNLENKKLVSVSSFNKDESLVKVTNSIGTYTYPINGPYYNIEMFLIIKDIKKYNKTSILNHSNLHDIHEV
ncbi:hypothetical protein D3C87_1246650 [compost metagenome]